MPPGRPHAASEFLLHKTIRAMLLKLRGGGGCPDYSVDSDLMVTRQLWILLLKSPAMVRRMLALAGAFGKVFAVSITAPSAPASLENEHGRRRQVEYFD